MPATMVEGFTHFGGRHGESAQLKNLLAFAGVRNPASGESLTESLCFTIAGGIGAGYSFCPSVIRYGVGSGVAVVGRHKSYSTSGEWQRGFFERLGLKMRVTETSASGKAYKNLLDELVLGRPVIVWCSRAHLPFLGNPMDACALWMHSFIVFGVDESKGLAHGADILPKRVSLTLAELAAARNAICSHKNRTLAMEPRRGAISPAGIKSAVRAGLQACAAELLKPRIKTYSLQGLTLWSKMIVNEKATNGWLKIFAKDGLLYCALRDVFDSIETAGTGGGLYRPLFAEGLEEAAGLLKLKALIELAGEYRELAQQWTDLAEASLPSKHQAFKQTKALLRQSKTDKLPDLERTTRAAFPLDKTAATGLLEDLREKIVALESRESAAAARLAKAVA